MRRSPHLQKNELIPQMFGEDVCHPTIVKTGSGMKQSFSLCKNIIESGVAHESIMQYIRLHHMFVSAMHYFTAGAFDG